MDRTIFKRRELKFLVDEEQRQLLTKTFAEYMRPDEHGESTICNIYYDTPDFRLIRRSLEKPVYKEKLRLRSYGQSKPDGTVFLELKKKYKGVVYKRRIALTEQQASDYLDGKAPLPCDNQIGREIEYFANYYKGLAAAVYLCYDRTAYFAADDPDLRVTFDRNIRWRREDMRLTSIPQGRDILRKGESLMEIKAGAAMPLWLTELLSKLEIRQTSFSKYGRAYQTMLGERLGRNTDNAQDKGKAESKAAQAVIFSNPIADRAEKIGSRTA